MKKRNLLFIGLMTAFLLTGCQTNTDQAETEALKQQITQLEQQVTALEQQTSSSDQSADASESASSTEKSTGTEEAAAQQQEAPAESATPAQGDLSTTYSIEELTSMVDAFEEKARAAVPTGASSEDMEQFFTLKQEENQIDDALDLHEDELEYQYRNGTLTRDEYRTLERELERLEDRLDDAEDRLELTFGIDD